MNTRVQTWILISGLLFSLLILSALSAPQTVPDESWKNIQEVVGLVWRAYVDRVDMKPLLPAAMGGLTDALDPFSTFVPSHQVDAHERVLRAGSSRSGLIVLKDRGVAFVAAVVPSGPGSRVQLRGGDILEKIDGLATRSMPRWKLQKLLAAESGQRLNLEVLRAGQKRRASLELGEFEWPALELRAIDGIPVLALTRIDSREVAEIGVHLDDLSRRGGQHLVLDLRNCAWGRPEAAYEAASLLSAGPLGSLRRKAESIQSFEGAERPRWQGKLAILTARSTLGPGEILARVLKSKGVAELIGERTFGYAGRVEKHLLSSGEALWLTGAFYADLHGVIFRQGIEPDLKVAPQPSGTSRPEDAVLRRALQRLKEES